MHSAHRDLEGKFKRIMQDYTKSLEDKAYLTDQSN
jgi:hypothetical protein